VVDFPSLCENARAKFSEDIMHVKRTIAVLAAVCLLSLTTFAQKKTHKATSAAGTGVTKDYLQKIWNGWAALNPPEQAQYYAKGPHVFFDIAPLKYDNWEEYQAGVSKVLGDYKAAKFVVNDDAEIHHAGADIEWVTATVASDMTHKSGKREMGTFRWTAVFQKEQGKWLIVHEHVSAPIQ
jgi:ketosteroid isomerase-like protein